uniref:Glutathione peroxidase n=1 Tax=Echinostoma caproni TaxID=27848 RepID=A0A183B9F5_9TREM
LTETNYHQLQSLYTNFAGRGLRILAFPCNQFGGQEPGTDAEIKERILNKFNVTFDLFAKVDVNGENAIPLYEFLKSKISGPFYYK